MRQNPRTYNKSGLSKSDRFREYYAKHPRKFIEKYCKIRTKKPGAPIELMQLKASQIQVLDKIQEQVDANKPIRLVILKSRQVGISTLVAAYVFGSCYNQNNMEAMVMAHEKDVTTNLFRTYRRYLEQLPSELQIPLERSNKEELIWKPTNTLIKVGTAGTKQTTRSRTIQWFHGSEAAFYQDLKTTRQAMEGSVPLLPGCGIIWETTAFGTGGDFHNLWLEAAETDTAYEQLFLEWFRDEDCQREPFASQRDQDEYLERIFAKKPGLADRMEHYRLTPRQIGFYYETCRDKFGGDELLMATEYPCDPDEAFVATGQPVFPTHLTQKYKLKTRRGRVYDPTYPFKPLDMAKESEALEPNKHSYLEVWVPPQPKRQYVISVDSAAGLQTSDYTCAYVFDILSQNICAELHGKIEPRSAADMVISLAELYSGAMIAPENDGLGAAVLSHIKDRYFNIYQWRRLDGFGWKTTNILGWETTEQSRLEMIATARRLYAERVADAGDFIPAKMLIHELGTFVNSSLLKNNKAVADKGCSDDRVMAWCIGISVCMQEIQCRPDLAILAEASKALNAETEKEKSDPQSLIELVRNPLWTGAPLPQEKFDSPFYMEDDEDAQGYY